MYVLSATVNDRRWEHALAEGARWELQGRSPKSIPNPATNIASIRFDIQETVPAILTVFNAHGETVATLLDGKTTLIGGQHRVDFDLSSLPPGVYAYVLRAGIFSDTKQMVIVK